jgi:hypothetical protein
LKSPITKNWAGRVAQGKDPEFKPQYYKNKTKQNKKDFMFPEFEITSIILHNYQSGLGLGA